MMDTGLKPKSKTDPYPREDGESYSIKLVTPTGDVYYGASWFGDKTAQDKRLNETKKQFPDGWEVEVIR